jgi:pyridoxamine 5'-phosphate oxidase family protein
VTSSRFTDRELAYLQSGERLARIATVGRDGMPHVVPTGWSYNTDHDTLDIGGIDLTATKKYRDAARNGVAAVVIDDVLPPWHPRGIEVRGRAEIVQQPEVRIRIHPTRIVSWGLESEKIGERNGRDVPDALRPS